MRKLKEVLRLNSLGLKQQQIARSCSIAQSTVHQYLKAAAAAGVRWPLPPDWDDRRLEEAVSGAPRPMQVWRKSEKPDFGSIRHELQRHRHLTLQLVWEEYRQDHPDGYSYSRFCELYRHWVRKLDVVLRHEYRAGEKLFVDYAGDKIPIYDRHTGEVDFQASLFVAVLGASSYTFAEATRSQDLSCWISSHIRALEFMGGAPEVVVPDNTKTGVKHPCRYEPELNPTYRELAEHYGFAVVPARPYRPRDKAKVEAGVQLAQRWIIAALRRRKFFNLGDLNEAIMELLDGLNGRCFRKRPDVSRTLLFHNWTAPRSSRCPPKPMSSLTGNRSDPISIITSRSNGITTACRFNSWVSHWRRATRRLPSRSSIAAHGSPPTSAATRLMPPPPFTNTGPRVIRRIWSGPPRV